MNLSCWLDKIFYTGCFTDLLCRIHLVHKRFYARKFCIHAFLNVSNFTFQNKPAMIATEHRFCISFKMLGKKVTYFAVILCQAEQKQMDKIFNKSKYNSPSSPRVHAAFEAQGEADYGLGNRQDYEQAKNISVTHPLQSSRSDGSAQEASHPTLVSFPGNIATVPPSTLPTRRPERMTLSRARSGGSITIISQVGAIPLPLYPNPASVQHSRSPTMPISMYPLPPAWSTSHDRAICILDANDHSLAAIVLLVKRTFPELASATLTLDALQRRLETLDQNVELDYWAVALKSSDEDRGEETRLN